MRDDVLAHTPNMSEIVFRALQTGLCTYMDLKTRIGYESAMNIIEADQVMKYNEAKIRYLLEKEEQAKNGN